MTTRDYVGETLDNEHRAYAYSFDYEVMHPLMMRAFSPHFVGQSVLEIGSFEGRFTELLLQRFPRVTCIEASPDAARIARERLDSKAEIHCVEIEQWETIDRFENIVLTHVLEHVVDPVAVLQAVAERLLAPGGRVFVACPNANAASRRIAVIMGLISHHSAVTAGEALHGHQRTYSLDTLRRDVVAAGLSPLEQSGIFFKQFANFQWDAILPLGIVSDDFINASYLLGREYPDLCASIFVVAK